MLLALSSMPINPQYVLNQVSWNRNTCQIRLYIDWLTKMLWPEAHRTWPHSVSFQQWIVFTNSAFTATFENSTTVNNKHGEYWLYFSLYLCLGKEEVEITHFATIVFKTLQPVSYCEWMIHRALWILCGRNSSRNGRGKGRETHIYIKSALTLDRDSLNMSCFLCVYFVLFLFWLSWVFAEVSRISYPVAGGILVLQPGISPLIGSQIPNHWTTREVPKDSLILKPSRSFLGTDLTSPSPYPMSTDSCLQKSFSPLGLPLVPKRKYNQRNEKMHKQRKTVKQNKIVLV